VAGFFHELILMNYGGIRLKERFLARAYELCRAHDVPTLVDEIQSCIWSPELFLFREYRLKPDFVSVGKGFRRAVPRLQDPVQLPSRHPGPVRRAGHQRAGRAGLPGLPDHHGVRAGQRRLRARAGEYYHKALCALARKHPRLIDCIEGQRHLSALFFRSEEKAVAFIKALNEGGVDISAQTYKASCPPSR